MDLLKQRGMILDDAGLAEFHLKHLSYYRLSNYWIPFEADRKTRQFKPGTRFEEVIRLYMFDRQLRLLILEAVERIEVSVRSQWAYHLGHKHGPHAHLEKSLFDGKYWERNKRNLAEEVERSDERFIEEHRNLYEEELPPVWVVSEVMSLGLLSKWCTSLKPKATRRAIARVYGLDDDVLISWLRRLCLARNLCAHHSRFWNRDFTVTPKIPKSKQHSAFAGEFVGNSRKPYNTLLILLYWLDVISPGHSWRSRLKKLIQEHHSLSPAMDCPQDWLQSAIWNPPVSP
jgi:abortive infection bacteriophage resistance protein